MEFHDDRHRHAVIGRPDKYGHSQSPLTFPDPNLTLFQILCVLGSRVLCVPRNVRENVIVFQSMKTFGTSK